MGDWGWLQVLAAVYARVSTEEQAQRGYSLQGQIEACRQKAAELGASAIDEFIDDGVSGATLERPAMNRLREGVREKRYGVVVALDPDRLSRNLIDLLLLTDEIQRAGSRVVFVNMSWENTPEGVLFLSVRGAISQYEKAKILQRTMFGKRQKVRRGGIAHPPSRLFGYVYDPVTDALTVDDAQAEAVRRIFALCLEGLGARRIAKKLTEEGWPSPEGRGWVYGTISRILRNPVYKGLLRQFHKGQGFKDTKVPPMFVPVPAIVPEDVWEEAQACLEERRRLPPGRPRHEGGKGRAFLGGRVFCGDCSRRMYLRYKRGRGPAYYVCPGADRGGHSKPDANAYRCPNRSYWSIRLIDSITWAEAARTLRLTRDQWEWLWEAALASLGREREEKVRERQRLQAYHGSLVSARERVITLMSEGVVTEAEAARFLKESLCRMKDVENRLRELHALDQGASSLASIPAAGWGFINAVLGFSNPQQGCMVDDVRQGVLSLLRVEVAISSRGRVTIRGSLHCSDQPKGHNVVAIQGRKGDSAGDPAQADLLCWPGWPGTS